MARRVALRFWAGRATRMLKRGQASQMGPAAGATAGAVVGYRVPDHERGGVVEFQRGGRGRAIIERPAGPFSDHAVTGHSVLNGRAPNLAPRIHPSPWGAAGTADISESYCPAGPLQVEKTCCGFAWLDTGTQGGRLDAGPFIRILTGRQGQQAGCPDEIACRRGWNTPAQLAVSADIFRENGYGRHLFELSRHRE